MQPNTSNTKTIATISIVLLVIIVAILAMWMDKKTNSDTVEPTATSTTSNGVQSNNAVSGQNSGQNQNTTVTQTGTVSNKTLLQQVTSISNASIFVGALKAAGIESALTAQGPFTVFVPSNGAFDKIPDDVLAVWMKAENKARLISILNYHIVPGKFTSATLKDGQTLRTVFGQTLKVSKSTDGTISINGTSQIEMRDIAASNGNVFVVSSVLQPNLPTLK